MKRTTLTLLAVAFGVQFALAQQKRFENIIEKPASEFSQLKGKKILYTERDQFAPDHHNTATLFQLGEINQDSFDPGSAMRIYDVDTDKITTLVDCPEGIVRDPEISWDGTKIVFSMRKNKADDYHIYQMNLDGTGMEQLTFAKGISDIDPAYLPDGKIVFTSTRQPKFCMCNRHIMGNLFVMDGDGANINQIGVSTLFEGHSTILSDGRILYERWEYVDRNFANAQALWTVNPDGTKHAIYYGNNTQAPDGVIDAREIPGTDLIVAIFGACHDRPWGAVAVVDRKKGVDGAEPVLDIMPASSRKLVGTAGTDAFMWLEYLSEDPWPLDRNNFLISSTLTELNRGLNWWENKTKSGIFMLNTNGERVKILEGTKSLFDPMVIGPRETPAKIPTMRNFSDSMGTFYVQDVYEGTHMEGVERGTVKYLRIVESPEKRTWSRGGWGGEGEQAPGMNWHSFELKRILGEVEVAEDGSANFRAPSGKHVFFQLLDKDKKMVQSMRSGVSLMPGEVNGCVGCHEDRLTIPVTTGKRFTALNKPAVEMTKWNNVEPRDFSYMDDVQPIFDKNCLDCHDFDPEKPEKFVLAGDRNMFFNASYINLYVKGAVKLVGGGPAQVQAARSWGSAPSKLTQVIDGKLEGHKRVKLSEKEKQMLYSWMDMNGVYYPTYETSFDENMAGRSPLTSQETAELNELTGLTFWNLNNWRRGMLAQISFERPELSPALYPIRGDKAKFDRAVEILEIGARRLEETPRGDSRGQISTHPRLQKMLDKYEQLLQDNKKVNQSIAEGEKHYEGRM